MTGIYACSEMPGKVSKMDSLKLAWNAWDLRLVWNGGKTFKNELFKTSGMPKTYALSGMHGKD